MSSILPFGLTFKNSLDSHVLFHSLLEEISAVLMKIPEYIKLKGNPEFLLLICRLIECKSPKGNSSLDKMDLCINIYTKLFGTLSPDEIASIKSQIQFFYDHGKIKGTSLPKLALYYVVDWVKRKLG